MSTRKGSYGVHNLSNGGRITIPYVDGEVFAAEDMRGDWNDIDVFDVDTSQRLPIGTILQKNARYWAYAEFGGVAAVATLCQAEVPAVLHDALAAVAASAGATEFKITSPASGADDFIKNEYAGGMVYAQVNGSPGYGYGIARNAALDIGVAGTMLVTLNPGENLAVSLASTDDMAFIKNPWKEVIIHPSPPVAPVVGVTMALQADGQFGWLGVKGPHPVLTDATTTALVIGQYVRPSEDDDGAVALLDYDETGQGLRGRVGAIADVGGDGGYSLVNFFGFGLV